MGVSFFQEHSAAGNRPGCDGPHRQHPLVAFLEHSSSRIWGHQVILQASPMLTRPSTGPGARLPDRT